MFDTREEILNQLRAGEDGRAEFKEMRFGSRGVLSPNTEELAGELVAFANAEGGAVFLGVGDSGAAARHSSGEPGCGRALASQRRNPQLRTADPAGRPQGVAAE